MSCTLFRAQIVDPLIKGLLGYCYNSLLIFTHQQSLYMALFIATIPTCYASLSTSMGNCLDVCLCGVKKEGKDEGIFFLFGCKDEVNGVKKEGKDQVKYES